MKIATHGSSASAARALALLRARAPLAQATTCRKNVRSSARMNLFSSAKLKFAMPSLSARSAPGTLIGRKAIERDQREGDVVGAFMRQSSSLEVAAAFGMMRASFLEYARNIARLNGSIW